MEVPRNNGHLSQLVAMVLTSGNYSRTRRRALRHNSPIALTLRLRTFERLAPIGIAPSVGTIALFRCRGLSKRWGQGGLSLKPRTLDALRRPD